MFADAALTWIKERSADGLTHIKACRPPLNHRMSARLNAFTANAVELVRKVSAIGDRS